MGRCRFTFDSTTEKGISLGQLITVEDFSSDSRVIDLSSIANRKPILSVSNSNFEGGVGIGETISISYAVFCLKKKKKRINKRVPILKPTSTCGVQPYSNRPVANSRSVHRTR